jgi:hypothetical protein
MFAAVHFFGQRVRYELPRESCGTMDKKPIGLPKAPSVDSEHLKGKPCFIFSIGRQRYEIRVETKITPLLPRPAEVIPIDRGIKS